MPFEKNENVVAHRHIAGLSLSGTAGVLADLAHCTTHAFASSLQADQERRMPQCRVLKNRCTLRQTCSELCAPYVCGLSPLDLSVCKQQVRQATHCSLQHAVYLVGAGRPVVAPTAAACGHCTGLVSCSSAKAPSWLPRTADTAAGGALVAAGISCSVALPLCCTDVTWSCAA